MNKHCKLLSTAAFILILFFVSTAAFGQNTARIVYADGTTEDIEISQGCENIANIECVDEQAKMKRKQKMEYVNAFAGEWDSDYNHMVITVNGFNVTAEYDYNDGRIEATLSEDGKVMEGKWYETGNREGRMIFELSEDGNSITGKWGWNDDEPTNTWNATRIQE